MRLRHRAGTVGDFDEFYRTFFHKDVDDQALRAIIECEWRILLDNPNTMTMFVEDEHRAGGDRFMACGQGVFVSEAFARRACDDLPPWINAHVTRVLPDGSLPLLNLDGVARANAGEGLIGLMTRWMMRDGGRQEDAINLRDYLHRAFEKFSRGYNFKALLIESTGVAAQHEAMRAGFRVVNDYSEYFQKAAPSPESQPCLLRLTREEASAGAGTGSLLSYAFAYTPPLCFFTRRQQEVLHYAMQGCSDKIIATRLRITVHAVRQHWKTMYQRVEDHLPDLLPAGADGKRGAEKQRVLLHYLREHPEELRPYASPRLCREKQIA